MVALYVAACCGCDLYDLHLCCAGRTPFISPLRPPRGRPCVSRRRPDNPGQEARESPAPAGVLYPGAFHLPVFFLSVVVVHLLCPFPSMCRNP